MSASRVRRTRRRVRVLEGDVLVTEILDHVGPTHGYFDVLAAASFELSPGPKVAVLGFGAGGFIPPLRALGGTHEIHAVDLSASGYQLFRETFGRNETETRIHFCQDDAASWLRRRRSRFDFILEDLSEMQSGDPFKPETSLLELPRLLPQRLNSRGVLATTVLPRFGWSRERLLRRLGSGLGAAVVIHFDDLETGLLLAGNHLPSASDISRRLRRALSTIRSKRRHGISVRSVTARG